jgi:hypothetical protein
MMHKRTATILVLMVCAIVGHGLAGSRLSQPAAAQSGSGTIAYIRGGNELRLIEPDGRNDRAIWALPPGDPTYPFTISDLDWRPDAAEIAFASDHERVTSIFERDMYAIGADGFGLRKLTNGPVHGALAAYPKGSVTLTVRNNRGGGPYLIYVAGAPEPQMISGPAGSTQTLTFPNVADFGPGHLQSTVAMFGLDRWFSAAAAADVQAGQTVHAGTLTITGAGLREFGASQPSWRADGSALGFMQSCAAIKQVPVNPPPGLLGEIAVRPNVSGPTCFADWGPTPALNNHVLYHHLFPEQYIRRTTRGSTDAGELLVTFGMGDLLLDLQWLPDGSGFLYTIATDWSTSAGTWQTANIHLYRFASPSATRLTNFSGDLARGVSVSPDGQWIVFDRAESFDGASDLWLMRHDGSNLRRLVQNGTRPAWSLRAPQIPQRVFVPSVIR